MHLLKFILTAALAPWAASLALPALAASNEVDTGHVRATLVASVDAVQPGQRITVGLHQRIIEHWHTYWLNPGDSGLPTTLAWTLPEGAKAGDIQWPIPSRFKLGPVTNHGYEREVTLLTDIEVPRSAPPGGTFPIAVKANWLVCQETCIPQEAQLQLQLPVAAANTQVKTGHPWIEQARAQLPVALAWPLTARKTPQGLALQFDHTALKASDLKDAWFYPAAWGHVAHNAEQPRHVEDGRLTVELQQGEAPVQAGSTLEGVLVVHESGKAPRGYSVSTVVQPGAAGPGTAAAKAATGLGPNPSPGSAPAPQGLAPAGSEPSAPTLAAAVVLALLGGLVLNLMPCVFPVLSIKALSLLQHHQGAPAQARLHGLVYTAGVLASFALLAGVLIALKAGGAQVGWGFQFQSPVFVLVVAYLMFAVGLSLSGVYTIGAGAAGLGSSLADKPGYAGSFFTGVLATVVATPCTAPFMGGAVGYALTQPAPVLLAVFLSLGLGLALPYLLLTAWPRLQRWMPRPGVWMERVKQALAFPMYAAAAWLVWVLAQQAGVDAVAVALAGMVGLAFAAWLYDSARGARPRARHAVQGLSAAALAVVLLGSASVVDGQAGAALAQGSSVRPGAHGRWQPYSPERLQALRAKGAPVFLNMTAAWCITCLVNERVALSKEAVSEVFKAQGVTYLKGDWTNQDPHISEVLARFGRSGVPLYVYYPHGAESQPVVLPQILTPELVVQAVRDASAARTSLLSSSPTTRSTTR